METSIAEAVLLPWWKPVVYIVVATLGIITIRISIKFDVNTWMQSRNEKQSAKRRLKRSKQCPHLWTLYHSSPYSKCDNCQSLISTSILLTALEFPDSKPIISCEAYGYVVKPGTNQVITGDYVGAWK